MKKNIFSIILGILIAVIIGVVVVTIVFVNKDSTNSTTKVSDSELKSENETSKTAQLIDDLPKYNNYTYYELKDAVQQSWFSQIGNVGEIKTGGTTKNPYQYADVKIGFDTNTHTAYMYPDAIILQGRLNGMNSGYGQTIITREQYDAESGYKFVSNVLEIAGYSEDEIISIIKKNFGLTDEQVSNNANVLNALFSGAGDEFSKSLEKGKYTEMTKDIPWDFYDYLSSNNMKMTFGMIIATDTMSEILDYDFYIKGGCGDEYAQTNGDGIYRIILVYDDLKVNVNINYSEDDAISYFAKFQFYSKIFNQEAYNQVIESLTKK
jgi:hypothetical protein